jgi:TolB-like protein/class 3 adenylate cyclase/Tfp pilus assembly protein PilF
MPAEVNKEIELEIAHVLFLDIVGYSKLSVNEQHGRVDELNQIVRLSEQFQKAEATNRILKIPTGDGMALVFYKSPEEPAQCAFEISRALKDNQRLQVRMGIHSGPVSGVVDVNERTNVAGAGINLAQRVMDCGDAGHILLSHHVAEDLAEYERWRPFLHDIGTFEVKHGARVSVTNLYSDEVGNPQLPTKLRVARRQRRRLRLAALAIAVLLVAAIAAAFLLLLRKPMRSALAVAEKSIAVLPFENLSSDKENAYFADGIQDEILTNLAKVADLKVISRTSVMQYKSGTPRNLRQVAQELGVAHVLEGSVQRASNRVRVNAQLIDARNDAHLWARTYDRDLADVFAIQTEIAKAIADELKANLSPKERQAIGQVPTNSVPAYDLYVRAKALLDASVGSSRGNENMLQAASLLEQAIGLDPNFLLAYCELSRAHGYLYFFGRDHTPKRLAMADAAVQSALRLRPDSGQAHLAAAAHFYRCYRDYDRARAELDMARLTLPNSSEVFEITGYIDRRQGRWDDSTRSLERALQLDPRNTFILQQVATNYNWARRYKEVALTLDRISALAPEDTDNRVARAAVELDWRADPRPLHDTINEIVTKHPAAAAGVAQPWFDLALCEHDPDAAVRALAIIPAEGTVINGVRFPRTWFEALAARLRGDEAAMRVAFDSAHREMEPIVHDQPDYAAAVCVLGLIDAGLGNKDQAIREGKRACELMPVSKDSVAGPLMQMYLAVIYAWVGDKDLAVQQLSNAIPLTGDLSYGNLRVHLFWDPLRGYPPFEALVASLAPKDGK